jgi:hypothetical protein
MVNYWEKKNHFARVLLTSYEFITAGTFFRVVDSFLKKKIHSQAQEDERKELFEIGC